METQNALVIGIGYVGLRLVEKINSLGIKVFGLSRNEKSLEKLERYNAQKIYWDEKSLLDFSLVDNIKLSLIGRNKNSLDFLSDLTLDQDIYQEAFKFLKEVDLEHKSEQLVSSLSHGEKRKLEVCIALSMKPKLFLLDEPMAGVDENSSILIIKLFKKIKTKAPILLIEHDMDTVFSLADRISVLDYGKIIASGTVDEIRNNNKVKEIYLGSEK